MSGDKSEEDLFISRFTSLGDSIPACHKIMKVIKRKFAISICNNVCLRDGTISQLLSVKTC